MKIVLVNLDLDYPIDFYPSKKQSIGIGYLAAVLNKQGHETIILEERFHTYRDVRDSLLYTSYDVIGFSFTGFEFSKSYNEGNSLQDLFNNPVINLICDIKNHKPNQIIILGGYSASFWDNELLSLFPINYILRSESEVAIVKLMDYLNSNIDISNVPNLSYTNNGVIYRNDCIALPNLNDLPIPIRLKHEPSDWITINSSRGCYGQCSFCTTFSLYGEKQESWWRARTPKSVFDEILYLVSLGYQNFAFAEDNFIGTEPERALNIANMIISSGIKCNFRFDCRTKDIEYGLFSAWAKAGLKRIFVGSESGSKIDLELYKKGIDAETNITGINIAKSLGVAVNAGVIMFNPLSTLETLESNINFLERIDEIPQLVQLASKLVVFKGTTIARYFEELNIVKYPFYRYQIKDAAASWVHDEFFNYANNIINRIRTKEYRSGDTERDFAYFPDSEHLLFFKKLIKEAKLKF